jgi:hypothetical protein
LRNKPRDPDYDIVLGDIDSDTEYSELSSEDSSFHPSVASDDEENSLTNQTKITPQNEPSPASETNSNKDLTSNPLSDSELKQLLFQSMVSLKNTRPLVCDSHELENSSLNTPSAEILPSEQQCQELNISPENGPINPSMDVKDAMKRRERGITIPELQVNADGVPETSEEELKPNFRERGQALPELSSLDINAIMNSEAKKEPEPKKE